MTGSTEPKTALVIGGGVIGLAIALNLQLRGIATILFDQPTTSTAASWGNAGHIATEQCEPLASAATLRSMPTRLFWRGGPLSLPLRDISAWLPFGLRLVKAATPARFESGCAALGSALGGAMEAWRHLLDRIGARELLLGDGHFIVWESDDTARQGRAHWMRARTGRAQVRDATPEELLRLRKLFPAPIAGAVHVAGSGQIADLDMLAEAMRARFDAIGGSCVREGIERLVLENGQAVAVAENGAGYSAAALMVTAGVASRALMEGIGHKVPLIAERGYHVQAPADTWPMGTPPVVFEDRSMIVTRFTSGLRAASFVEFGRADSAADPRKWARLRAHIAALGLPFALPGREWMGARPTFPDYLPAIGRSRHADNLFYAFGHQHLGLTLAAVTAEAMTALMAGTAPPFDLTPFDIDRFGVRV